MADEQDRDVVGCEELLEPLDALEVEVVRGPVEEQQVGMAQEQLREGYAHLPATRELLGRLAKVLDRKTKAPEDLTGSCVELIAPQTLVAVLGGTIAFEEPIELLAGRGIRDLVLHLLDAVFEATYLDGRVDHLCQGELLPRQMRFLLEIADRRVAREANRSRVGALLPHEVLEQRRLASAVGPDKPPISHRH